MPTVSGEVSQSSRVSPSSDGQTAADVRPQKTPVMAMFEPGYAQLSGFFCVVQTVILLAANKKSLLSRRVPYNPV